MLWEYTHSVSLLCDIMATTDCGQFYRMRLWERNDKVCDPVNAQRSEVKTCGRTIALARDDRRRR